MKLLIDTHILQWMVAKSDSLTRFENRAIARASGSILLSAVTFWEMRVKWDSFDRRGRRKGLLDPAIALRYAEQMDFTVAPLTAGIAAASLRRGLSINDPFDEMLLIHAQELGARILTRDARMLEHPLALQP